MSYDLVYSIPRDLYTPRALLALLGVPVFLFGRALWRHIEATDVWDWLGQLLLPSFLQFAGLVMVLFFFVIPTFQGLYLGLQLARGHYEIVEGTVHDFTPGDGHVSEQWSVVGRGSRRTYSYNPYRMTPGFDRIQGERGPIRPGLRVRLADVNGHIARLEIAHPSP